FADIDVTIRAESDHHGLPQQALSLRFAPVSASSPDAECQQKLARRTQFHDGRAIRVGDPHIIPGIDSHAVCLLLMADHVIAELQYQFAIRAEFEELRTSRCLALKDPEVALGIQRHGWNATGARR